MKRDPAPAARQSPAYNDLLVELGTEELPPRTLQHLSQALATDFAAALRQNDIQYSDIVSYATPRRLAILMHDVADRQPDGLVERRGPSLATAFDEDGRPTPAAEGFARSCGVAVESLVALKNDKGAWLVFRKTQPGRALTKLLPELLAGALTGLPVAKKMRWGSLRDEFVRPVHWLVVLYGDEVVDTRLYGVQSGRLTYGHRFHHPEPIQLIQPSTYAPLLESEGHVMADFATRRQAILGLVTEAAMTTAGRAVIDDTLLDEVTGLVEWPSAVLGRFDQRFLEIPEEAVIAALRDHQKCFHVVHEDGHLLPCFIAISNIESCQPELVRGGFERVIRPRLADADFFWRQDCQETLESRLERLKKVVFQQQLGSMYDKITRIARLAVHIAELLGCNTQLARQAALLSKSDLVTRMVGEFPELQGIMGHHYAIHEGLPEEVADALAEQYQPRFAGDGLPPSTNGQILAMADKIDTLTAIFAIGQVPTGDRDPFALRRHALGVLRILIEKQIDLDLLDLLQKAYDPFANRFDTGIPVTVFDFMVDRLKAYYAEQGIRNKVFDAVLACRPTRPYDFARRIEAVEAFRKLPAAATLAAANKRIRNILRQTNESIPPDFDLGSMTEPAERMLATKLLNMQVALEPVLQNREYKQALIQLADLRDGVDTFFDEVLVMCEDPAIRTNRLALLQRMQSLFLRIADVSRL